MSSSRNCIMLPTCGNMNASSPSVICVRILLCKWRYTLCSKQRRMIPLTVCCDWQASVSALKQITKTTEKQKKYLGFFYLSSKMGTNIFTNSLFLTYIMNHKDRQLMKQQTVDGWTKLRSEGLKWIEERILQNCGES